MSISKLYNTQLFETYQFCNPNLRLQALTHSSYEDPVEGFENNERLEFLGDAVLSMLSTIFIFTKFPDWKEGELTELRSKMVCNETLSQIAKELQLQKQIRVGKSLVPGSLFIDSKIWSNTVEALIGAIFLDLDMNFLRMQDILFPYFDSIVHSMPQTKRNPERNFSEQLETNPIGSLQSWAQQSSKGLPEYKFDSIVNANSGLEFCAKVYIQRKLYGSSSAGCEKEAKKRAVKTALLLIRSNSIKICD